MGIAFDLVVEDMKTLCSSYSGFFLLIEAFLLSWLASGHSLIEVPEKSESPP